MSARIFQRYLWQKWCIERYAILQRCSKAFRPRNGIFTNLYKVSAVPFKRTFPMFLLGISPVFVKGALTLDKCKLKKMLEQADKLYEDVKYQELYDLLNPHREEGNAEILWRLARVIYELVRYENPENKLKGLNEAYELTKEAIAIDDKCGPAYKWCSILLEARSGMMGIKAKVSSVSGIRDHIQRAIELIPQDGTSHHVLGQWHYTIADLPWYQRKLVSAACRSSLNASFEEALEHFQRSESVNPNGFSKNLLMIGKTYLKLNNKEKAKEFLIRVRDYPQKTPNDKEAHEEAIIILASLGIS